MAALHLAIRKLQCNFRWNLLIPRSTLNER